MFYILLLLLVTLTSTKNINLLSNQAPYHTILQQQTTLQMSTLSLLGSPAAEQPAYLELISMPNGYAKIQIEQTSTVEGSALRWMYNDQTVLSMSAAQISTQAQKLVVNNIRYQGALFYSQQPQWKLVTTEQFWQPPLGWSDSSTSTCGGIIMLGGYAKFAGGEVTKTFEELPAHSRLRIVASYHFIDAWNGESGFLRADIGRDNMMEYLWTEKYDYSKAKNGINVCGSVYPEGKLTSTIDVTIPHIADTITIGFGSTLDQDPEENSFGVSNIQLYIL